MILHDLRAPRLISMGPNYVVDAVCFADGSSSTEDLASGVLLGRQYSY